MNIIEFECKECDGRGRLHAPWRICVQCDGTGLIMREVEEQFERRGRGRALGLKLSGTAMALASAHASKEIEREWDEINTNLNRSPKS